jgi:hypothetical protein
LTGRLVAAIGVAGVGALETCGEGVHTVNVGCGALPLDDTGLELGVARPPDGARGSEGVELVQPTMRRMHSAVAGRNVGTPVSLERYEDAPGQLMLRTQSPRARRRSNQPATN